MLFPTCSLTRQPSGKTEENTDFGPASAMSCSRAAGGQKGPITHGSVALPPRPHTPCRVFYCPELFFTADTQPQGPQGNLWRLEEAVGRAFAPSDVQQKGFAGGVLGAFLCQG